MKKKQTIIKSEFDLQDKICVWMGKIDTGVEHRMPVLPVISQACGEFHTRQKVFRRALQKSY